MESGKLYSIKVKNRKNLTQGILVEEGEEWLFLIQLYTDYIIDGYQLVNKKYIEYTERTEKDIFTEKVLIANKKIHIPNLLKIPLSTEQLLSWFYNSRITVQIDNNDEMRCWIGKMRNATTKYLYLDILSPDGIWTGTYYTFKKDCIRLISFESDYINSLLAYNKVLENKLEDDTFPLATSTIIQ